MSFRSRAASGPFARVAALPVRANSVARHVSHELSLGTTWLIKSREHHNFTYDLTDRNLTHLASWVSIVTGAPTSDCLAWIYEALNDDELNSHVQSLTQNSNRKGLADRETRIGRRAGWYAVVRATRPKVVIETGTDKGLGSVVLAAALLRNGEGHLITMDINPAAGYLVASKYAEVTSIEIGDSVSALSNLDTSIDLFIHDSDHSPEHEYQELTAVQPHLSSNAIVLSDNSHATDSLIKWANETNRNFLYFQERPLRHWYPGAGIGASWISH